MPRFDPIVDEIRRSRQRECGLRDIVPRLRLDAPSKLVSLAGRAVRADQHAIATRLADRLYDELVEILEHVRAISRVGQQVRLDVRQNRLFVEIETNNRRHVRIDRLVVGDACADGVHNRHVARPISVEQAGHAKPRVWPERQRIDKIVVHAPINHIDAAQPGRGPHVHNVVVHDEVASFDELDAHLASKKRVLEVRRVEDAWRQQHNRRIAPVARGERPQCRQEGLTIMIDRTHRVVGEQLREHPLDDLPVRQHVRHAARHTQVVFEHRKLPIRQTD